MATPQQHQNWCTGQLTSYFKDKHCDSCGSSDGLVLVYRKSWWREVSVLAWAQSKSNLTTTLSRSRITCETCIQARISEIKDVLESGIKHESCQDNECSGKSVGRGFCAKHYPIYMRVAGVSPRNIAKRGDGAITPEGYRRVTATGHPNANRYGLILEHRKVMADRLGRPLRKNENVHHKNGDRRDNSSANLELWLKSHPPGQRVSDQVAWAREIIELYGEEVDSGVTDGHHR